MQQLTRRGVAVLVAWSLAAISLAAQKPIDPQTAINNAFNQSRSLEEGKNANYIPALAKVDPVFTMAQVIQEQGLDSIEKRIGVEGKWLYHTGLPAKSGVGGGLIAVSPGTFGIAVVSPPLDDAGNSVRAQRAIAAISNAVGGNPLAPTAR